MRTARNRPVVFLASLALLGGVLVAAPQGAFAAGTLTVADLTTGSTAPGLAQLLSGTGVSVTNATYVGVDNAAGAFTGGAGLVGFDSGIVFSSGSVQTKPAHPGPCSKGIEGANVCDSNTTENGTPGDPELDALAGVPTFDAAVLQFDFVPAGDSITFRYVFGSDEYPEYANTVYNDVFEFLVNDRNCALVPGTNEPVSINTINGGNPLGNDPRHSQYYVDNHYDPSAGSPVNVEMDGLTTVLTCTAGVTAGETNHMKLAIADGGDMELDSNVMLQAHSLVSPLSGVQVSTSLLSSEQSGPMISVPTGTAVHDQATLTGSKVSTAGGTVTYRAYTDVHCTLGAVGAGAKTVVNGSVPASDALTLGLGTYYWEASYSGDATHAAAIGTCGDEVLTVTPVPNLPPDASIQGVYAGTEGSPSYVAGTVSDPDGDPAVHLWSVAPFAGTDPGAACWFGDATALATTVTCNDDGVFRLTLTVSDGVTAPVSAGAFLNVDNVSPAVTIAAPALSSVNYAGSPVQLVAAYVDPGTNDTQVCSIDWGSGTTTAGYASGGSCTASTIYASAGVHPITVTVTDDDGGVGTAATTVVVVDGVDKVTGGGFVTNSGLNNFGFVVRSVGGGLYAGQLEVNGRGATNFHGSSVLTLSATTTVATWSGAGTWNGISGYRFTVTAADNGHGTGQKADTFAVTVRDGGGQIVFSIGGTIIGGQIVIH
jgi:hypothetical protein